MGLIYLLRVPADLLVTSLSKSTGINLEGLSAGRSGPGIYWERYLGINHV